MLEKCECGGAVSVWSTYCTSKGHGFTVNCSGCYPGMGPWAKTRNGAQRLWNAHRRKQPDYFSEAEGHSNYGNLKVAIDGW